MTNPAPHGGHGDSSEPPRERGNKTQRATTAQSAKGRPGACAGEATSTPSWDEGDTNSLGARARSGASLWRAQAQMSRRCQKERNGDGDGCGDGRSGEGANLIRAKVGTVRKRWEMTPGFQEEGGAGADKEGRRGGGGSYEVFEGEASEGVASCQKKSPGGGCAGNKRKKWRGAKRQNLPWKGKRLPATRERGKRRGGRACLGRGSGGGMPKQVK